MNIVKEPVVFLALKKSKIRQDLQSLNSPTGRSHKESDKNSEIIAFPKFSKSISNKTPQEESDSNLKAPADFVGLLQLFEMKISQIKTTPNPITDEAAINSNVFADVKDEEQNSAAVIKGHFPLHLVEGLEFGLGDSRQKFITNIKSATFNPETSIQVTASENGPDEFNLAGHEEAISRDFASVRFDSSYDSRTLNVGDEEIKVSRHTFNMLTADTSTVMGAGLGINQGTDLRPSEQIAKNIQASVMELSHAQDNSNIETQKTISFLLQPEALGNVSVSVSLRGDKLLVKINPIVNQTVEILENTKHELNSSLEAVGLQVSEVQIMQFQPVETDPKNANRDGANTQEFAFQHGQQPESQGSGRKSSSPHSFRLHTNENSKSDGTIEVRTSHEKVNHRRGIFL